MVIQRLLAMLVMAASLVSAATVADAQETSLLGASYDSTRELYAAYDALFETHWSELTGEKVSIRQSHGGSGTQAKAIIGGMEADVATLALGADIDAIAAKTHLLPIDWAKALPHNSSPYTSTIVFLVRHGNPRGIHDWSDVVRSSVAIVTANPKTSGGARWTFLAVYGHGLRAYDSNAGKALTFAKSFYKNVRSLDRSGRDATLSFVNKGIGDVLVGWESDAIAVTKEKPDSFEIVVPSASILAEPPVAVIEQNAKKHGAARVAHAYLEYLYFPDAQTLICRKGYRPRSVVGFANCSTKFASTDLTLTIDSFGGWQQAQKRFFADGALFDQIFQPAK